MARYRQTWRSSATTSRATSGLRTRALNTLPEDAWSSSGSLASRAPASRRSPRRSPELRAAGKRVEILDGDVVRTHLSKGLGFSREDRDTNVARIAFVAHLLARNGVVVLVAAICPFRETRDAARQLIGDFVEVHVAPPLEECIKRDVKGLYKKALAGEIPQFTGVSDPYEAPHAPELRIDTSRARSTRASARILAKLRELGYLDATKPAAARSALSDPAESRVMTRRSRSCRSFSDPKDIDEFVEKLEASRAARSTPSSSARSGCCAASTASARRTCR